MEFEGIFFAEYFSIMDEAKKRKLFCFFGLNFKVFIMSFFGLEAIEAHLDFENVFLNRFRRGKS